MLGCAKWLSCPLVHTRPVHANCWFWYIWRVAENIKITGSRTHRSAGSWSLLFALFCLLQRRLEKETVEFYLCAFGLPFRTRASGKGEFSNGSSACGDAITFFVFPFEVLGANCSWSNPISVSNCISNDGWPRARGVRSMFEIFVLVSLQIGMEIGILL